MNIFEPIPHVAPPRLLPLVLMAREQRAWTHYTTPAPSSGSWHIVAPCSNEERERIEADLSDSHEPSVRIDPSTGQLTEVEPERRTPLHSSLLMPAHVVTGSLRRGQNMLSVSYMRDEIRTAEVTQRRTEFQERCTRYRPDGIEAEPWREMFNKALLTRLEPRDALMVLAGLAQEAGLEWLRALPLELEGKDVWDRRAERERVTAELWERFALATEES